MGVKEDLEKTLLKLKNVNGIEGYALVREDGLPLITNLKSEIDLINLCSSCANINKKSSELESFDNVIIQYSEGNNIIIKKTDDETLLFCLTSKNANLSEILQIVKKISNECKGILG